MCTSICAPRRSRFMLWLLPRLENWFPTSSCQQSHIAGRGSSTLPLFQKTFFKGDVLDFSCSGLPLPPPKPSLWSFLHCQPARAEDWGGYWGPGRQLLSPKYQFLNFLSECQLIVSYCWWPRHLDRTLACTLIALDISFSACCLFLLRQNLSGAAGEKSCLTIFSAPHPAKYWEITFQL